jgi:hypothetical protein
MDFCSVLYHSTLVVRFEVLIAMNMEITAFWDVTPYSLVDVYQYFRETCYPYLQGRRGLYPSNGVCMFL